MTGEAKFNAAAVGVRPVRRWVAGAFACVLLAGVLKASGVEASMIVPIYLVAFALACKAGHNAIENKKAEPV